MTSVRTRETLQQFEENSTLIPALNIESLSSSEREQAKILAEGMKALLLKGLFHRVRPNEFPISPNRDALETRIAASIGAIDPRRFARMRPKIESLLNNPASITASATSPRLRPLHLGNSLLRGLETK